MKRGTIEHPKTKKLARLLGVPVVQVIGHLEAIWHFTARYAIAGDIGVHSDEEIAEAAMWEGEPAKLIEAMVESRWIDRDAKHRLLIHDWRDHADQAVRKTIKNRGEDFAKSTQEMVRNDSTQPDGNGTSGRSSPPILSLPEPEPVPQPVAEAATTCALDAFDSWAKHVLSRPLRTDELREIADRLRAMPDAVPHVPEAVRACRAAGVNWKGVRYVVTAVFNRIDEMRASGKVPRDGPALTPETLFNACKISIAFGGAKVPKSQLTWSKAGIKRDGKVWIPAERLSEAKIV